MGGFVKVENGSIVARNYTFRQLDDDHPETFFQKDILDRPEVMAEFGMFKVQPTTPPGFDLVEELPEAMIDGVPTQQWTGRDYTREEVEALADQLAMKATKTFSSKLARMRAAYSDDEIKTWDQQKAEADAWEADHAAGTPLLDAMLTNRTAMDKATLVAHIQANALVYANTSGALLGRKQAIADLVEAAKAIADDAACKAEVFRIRDEEVDTGWPVI